MNEVREVTININKAIVEEWGMDVGDPFMPAQSPTVIFLAEDIHDSLREGFVTFPNHGTLVVDRTGIATNTRPDGKRYVYELFPAKFNDKDPYEPLVYVGRWPD